MICAYDRQLPTPMATRFRKSSCHEFWGLLVAPGITVPHVGLTQLCTRNCLENRVIREDVSANASRAFPLSYSLLVRAESFSISVVYLFAYTTLPEALNVKRDSKAMNPPTDSFERTLKHASLKHAPRDKYLPVPRFCLVARSLKLAMSAPRFPPNGLTSRDNVTRSACTLY